MFALDQQGRGQLGLRHFELLAATQVLHRDHAARGLVLAMHHPEADARLVGVLQLLRQLARLQVGLDIEAGGTVTLKDLSNGEQDTVALDTAAEWLAARIKEAQA